MRNRYLVLGLASFLAVALAVPALGGPSNPVAEGAASAKKTAEKALKKAKKAKKKANKANRAAKGAQNTADGAQTTADAAQATGEAAQTAAEAAQTSADAAQASADAAQSTADSKFGDLDNVEGTASPTNNSDKAVVFAVCSGGGDVTGGGWIVNGTGADDAAVTFNTAYIGSWGVIAQDQGTNASTWSITPTARCIS